MKLVEDHLSIAAVLRHSGLIGGAHIHAHLRDGMPMAIVFFQCFHKFGQGVLVLAFGGKNDPLSYQVRKNTNVLVTLANTHLINPNTAHVAVVRLRIRRIHLAKEHAP